MKSTASCSQKLSKIAHSRLAEASSLEITRMFEDSQHRRVLSGQDSAVRAVLSTPRDARTASTALSALKPSP
jgi:hypothetical protein